MPSPEYFFFFGSMQRGKSLNFLCEILGFQYECPAYVFGYETETVYGDVKRLKKGNGKVKGELWKGEWNKEAREMLGVDGEILQAVEVIALKENGEKVRARAITPKEVHK